MFILHAEHEMNCSTAAARHLASSGVDVYTAIAGAVGALYGPLHGGANEAVLRMLERIGKAGRGRAGQEYPLVALYGWTWMLGSLDILTLPTKLSYHSG